MGFTPWEKAGRAGADGLAAMFDREEAEHGGPGKALDRARQRIADSHVQANLVQADATALPAGAVGTGFDFFLDLGCFHGLNKPERDAMARAVTARAKPDSTLLMFAFGKPVGPPFMPQGATRSDIMTAYGEWELVDAAPAPADRSGMPKFARNAQPTFYRLRRR